MALYIATFLGVSDVDNIMLFDSIVQLIDERFFFKDYEHENEWKENVQLAYLRHENTNKKEDFYRLVDKLLMSLSDPHTRINYPKFSSKIFTAELFWSSEKLYLCRNEDANVVVKLNGRYISDIWCEYVIRYKGYSSSLIKNQILQDIKLGTNSFTQAELTIEIEPTDLHSKIVILPSSVKQLKERAATVMSQLQQLNSLSSSIFQVPIENDTILLRILTFKDSNLVYEFNRILRNIKQRTVIIDVRDNGGGYTSITMELASLFLKKSISLDYKIVERADSTYKVTIPEIKAGFSSFLADKKIVIFANSNTMSSAEYIFVKTLKSAGYSVVGEQTCGHPNQAALFQLLPDLQLQITSKRFCDDLGYVEKGILPTIAVRQDPEDYSKGIDSYIKWYKSHSNDLYNK